MSAEMDEAWEAWEVLMAEERAEALEEDAVRDEAWESEEEAGAMHGMARGMGA